MDRQKEKNIFYFTLTNLKTADAGPFSLLSSTGILCSEEVYIVYIFHLLLILYGPCTWG